MWTKQWRTDFYLPLRFKTPIIGGSGARGQLNKKYESTDFDLNNLEKINCGPMPLIGIACGAWSTLTVDQTGALNFVGFSQFDPDRAAIDQFIATFASTDCLNIQIASGRQEFKNSLPEVKCDF